MRSTLGEAEIRLLSFLSEGEPKTVRETWEAYGQSQGYVRTTVLQMMERLRAKGFLVREKMADGWRYRAVSEKPTLLKSAVARFVTESLGGSVSPSITRNRVWKGAFSQVVMVPLLHLALIGGSVPPILIWRRSRPYPPGVQETGQ